MSRKKDKRQKYILPAGITPDASGVLPGGGVVIFRLPEDYVHLENVSVVKEEEIACRECGCTETNACYHPDHGACWWVEADLCSHCKKGWNKKSKIKRVVSILVLIFMFFIGKAQDSLSGVTFNRGYIITSTITNEVVEKFEGNVYLIWNKKKVPQKGIYIDTAFEKYDFRKNMTVVKYCVFYDGKQFFYTDFYVDTSLFWQIKFDNKILNK